MKGEGSLTLPRDGPLQDYPVTNISKDTKEYFEALVESAETKNDRPFVLFCYNTFVKQIKNRFLR